MSTLMTILLRNTKIVTPKKELSVLRIIQNLNANQWYLKEDIVNFRRNQSHAKLSDHLHLMCVLVNCRPMINQLNPLKKESLNASL